MLTVEQAQENILASLSQLGAERVFLLDAHHRVAAADVFATRDLPTFTHSAMDGYAVRAIDVATASMPVIDVAAAGHPSTRALPPGTAMRIFTGAPLPEGADAVVMQEDTTRAGDRVTITTEVRQAQNVRDAGSDLKMGSTLVTTGSIIHATTISVLAALGKSVLQVTRKPRVAIVATGDELVEIDVALTPGAVTNSNSLALAALVRDSGGIPMLLPTAADTPEALRETLQDAARSADFIITCGGVSVGDHDWVRPVLQQHGQIEFWKVAMKPGKPLAWGSFAGVPLLGLPGNPVSSFVCFEIFGRAALYRLQNHPQPVPQPRMCQLRHDLPRHASRREFLRCTLHRQDGISWADVLPHQGSGQQSSLLKADALLDVAAGEHLLPAGTRLPALVLHRNFCD